MHADGNAIVYCQNAFNTPNGKTAHGLVRFTKRYRVLSVIDANYAGQDTGKVLDGHPNDIPIHADLTLALESAKQRNLKPTHLVIGLAPDGGRLDPAARLDVRTAIETGLNVDSGLHDFISDDPLLSRLAFEKRVILRDIRKTPGRSELHFFSGAIEHVKALKVAVLGTDSAIGKRTTAWRLVNAFEKAGLTAEMIGTGQTAWMQGARYCIILDSLINDFVSGELEHAIVSAWKEQNPDVIVIEGQGSLMNPAYPGGFEILAAGRPDVIVLQHAPMRTEYDGFPGYRLHPLHQQIRAIQTISEKPVGAITLNHEGVTLSELDGISRQLETETGLPVVDVLVHGAGSLVPILLKYRSA